jgi:hypothetical protein
MTLPLHLRCAYVAVSLLYGVVLALPAARAADAPPTVKRSGTPSAAERDKIERAYAFLDAEMDRWVTTGTWVYRDRDDGAASFFPALMGDTGNPIDPEKQPADIRIEHADASECRVGGEAFDLGDTCLKITYTPAGPKGWAGIYWLYPDLEGGNWGQRPGRGLTGATTLTAWARGAKGGEVVELKIGGVNRHPHACDDYPGRDCEAYQYQDPFGPVNTEPSPRKALTRQWRKFEISVPAGADLRQVIGGFAFVVSAPYNPERVEVYLDHISYDDALAPGRTDPKRLRFLRSYVVPPGNNTEALRNAGHLYDNVLVLLAYLASEQPERLARAKVLADSLVFSLTHDRYWKGKEARWRNAYSCGPLENPADRSARLPGWYDPKAECWVEAQTVHGETVPEHCAKGRWGAPDGAIFAACGAADTAFGLRELPAFNPCTDALPGPPHWNEKENRAASPKRVGESG